MKWKGKDIKDIDTDYLKNIMGWIENKAEEGYTVLSGGGGVDADDIWFDEDTLFDEEVKEYFNYNIIKKEYNERQY